MLQHGLLKLRDGPLRVTGAIIGQPPVPQQLVSPIEQRIIRWKFECGSLLELVDGIAAVARLNISQRQVEARP